MFLNAFLNVNLYHIYIFLSCVMMNPICCMCAQHCLFVCSQYSDLFCCLRVCVTEISCHPRNRRPRVFAERTKPYKLFVCVIIITLFLHYLFFCIIIFISPVFSYSSSLSGFSYVLNEYNFVLFK